MSKQHWVYIALGLLELVSCLRVSDETEQDGTAVGHHDL